MVGRKGKGLRGVGGYFKTWRIFFVNLSMNSFVDSKLFDFGETKARFSPRMMDIKCTVLKSLKK